VCKKVSSSCEHFKETLLQLLNFWVENVVSMSLHLYFINIVKAVQNLIFYGLSKIFTAISLIPINASYSSHALRKLVFVR